MLSLIKFAFEWYLLFFVFCLVPSIILGVIFQYLVCKHKIRKFTVVLLTFISFVASIFINYFILGISVRENIYFSVVITIVLSTCIVSLVRSYLLDKRQYYINSFLEVVKTIVFAMFVTPLVMTVVFFSILFAFNIF